MKSRIPKGDQKAASNFELFKNYVLGLKHSTLLKIGGTSPKNPMRALLESFKSTQDYEGKEEPAA